MMPTRSETVRIIMSLDKRLLEEHAADIAIVTAISESGSGLTCDQMNISYTFAVDYFGDTQARLEAIERLLANPSIIRKADISELEYGRSVIVGVVQSLTRIIDALAAGDTNADTSRRPGAATPNPRRRPRWWPFH